MNESNTISKPRSGTQRTGGRSARVKQATLESAIAELTEVGYTNFNIGAVAKRAGVHESTIYRRWERKEELIGEACGSFASAILPVPDTGNLEEDLRIVFTNLAALLESPLGRTLIALSFSAHEDEAFEEMRESLWRTRIDAGQKVFEQAAQRGEWPATFDRSAVFAEVIGPFLAQSFILKEALTSETIERRIRTVLSMRG